LKNFPQTVISQYSDSAHLTALLGFINDWLEQDANFEVFYDSIWNIATAVGYGLDVWGRIVGVVRVLTVAADEYLGFEGSPGSASGDSFTVAPWYEGEPTTSNYSLTDDAFRQLIYAKAAANITNGSIQAINYILTNILFPDRGHAYVIDNLDMTMIYKFDYQLAPFEVAIVATSGVLPRPVGVSVSVQYVT
jgi:hypothetical protein